MPVRPNPDTERYDRQTRELVFFHQQKDKNHQQRQKAGNLSN